MKRLLLLAFAALLTSCAGETKYFQPTTTGKASNVKLVDRPREQVWNAAIPELGKRFFTINNLDKSSGLVNVSYSGDPEAYIDCGTITSFVKNARGERNYTFPGARAQMSYEMMENGRDLRLVDRRMSLEGRVNLIFEEVSPTQTRVTANTRYVLTRSQHVSAVDGRSANLSDSTSFNSNDRGALGSNPATSITCVPTGRLELDILGAIQ